MTIYAETLTEILSLSEDYSRVWAVTPEYIETIALIDTPTWAWEVAKEYTESFSLTDGDAQDQDIVKVSPNGEYISVIASESTLVATMNELIKILEKVGAPRSQTQIALSQNTDGTAFNAIAVIKRH